MANVLTKREKFIRLFESVIDFNLLLQHLYPIKGGKCTAHKEGSLYVRTSRLQQYEEYRDLYWDNTDSYNPVNSNSKKYQEALAATKEMLNELFDDWVGYPIYFPNNEIGYKTFDEYYKNNYGYLDSIAEWYSSEFGSQILCQLDDGTIRKIDTIRDADGTITNHLYGHVYTIPKEDFKEEITLMSEGLYIIDDFRFDICFGEVCVRYDDWNKHPIRKYLIEDLYREENQ